MKRRSDPTIPELMDRAQPVSAELKADLHNLRKLNRYFGSYRLVRHFLRRWVKTGDRVRMIDLATGSGDIPQVNGRLRAKGGRELASGCGRFSTIHFGSRARIKPRLS